MEDSDYVRVNAGEEYIEASDLSSTGKRGQFVENMDCQITNRAIVETMEDGSEKIVASSKGKTWEEAGIDLNNYKEDKYVEKYSLEALNGEKDSRGYSKFGWVNSDKCEKLYARTETVNGKKTTTFYTLDELNAMADNSKAETKTAHQSYADSIRVEVNGASQNAKSDSDQRTNSKDEMEI